MARKLVGSITAIEGRVGDEIETEAASELTPSTERQETLSSILNHALNYDTKDSVACDYQLDSDETTSPKAGRPQKVLPRLLRNTPAGLSANLKRLQVLEVDNDMQSPNSSPPISPFGTIYMDGVKQAPQHLSTEQKSRIMRAPIKEATDSHWMDNPVLGHLPDSVVHSTVSTMRQAMSGHFTDLPAFLGRPGSQASLLAPQSSAPYLFQRPPSIAQQHSYMTAQHRSASSDEQEPPSRTSCRSIELPSRGGARPASVSHDLQEIWQRSSRTAPHTGLRKTSSTHGLSMTPTSQRSRPATTPTKTRPLSHSSPSPTTVDTNPGLFAWGGHSQPPPPHARAIQGALPAGIRAQSPAPASATPFSGASIAAIATAPTSSAYVSPYASSGARLTPSPHSSPKLNSGTSKQSAVLKSAFMFPFASSSPSSLSRSHSPFTCDVQAQFSAAMNNGQGGSLSNKASRKASVLMGSHGSSLIDGSLLAQMILPSLSSPPPSGPGFTTAERATCCARGSAGGKRGVSPAGDQAEGLFIAAGGLLRPTWSANVRLVTRSSARAGDNSGGGGGGNGAVLARASSCKDGGCRGGGACSEDLSKAPNLGELLTELAEDSSIGPAARQLAEMHQAHAERMKNMKYKMNPDPSQMSTALQQRLHLRSNSHR